MILIETLNAVKEEWKDRLAISAEDYLHGLISLVNELVCLLIGARELFIGRNIFRCERRHYLSHKYYLKT